MTNCTRVFPVSTYLYTVCSYLSHQRSLSIFTASITLDVTVEVFSFISSEKRKEQKTEREKKIGHLGYCQHIYKPTLQVKLKSTEAMSLVFHAHLVVWHCKNYCICLAINPVLRRCNSIYIYILHLGLPKKLVILWIVLLAVIFLLPFIF